MAEQPMTPAEVMALAHKQGVALTPWQHAQLIVDHAVFTWWRERA